MNYLKECGVYAQRFNDGKISDNDVLPEKLAYTKDNLYDIFVILEADYKISTLNLLNTT